MIDLVREAKNRLVQGDVLMAMNTEEFRSFVERELAITVEMCYSTNLYSVKCDNENNTEETINGNKLVVHFIGNREDAVDFSLTLGPNPDGDGPKFDIEKL